MSKDFQEFQGSSLDDAIREACSFYDLPREKLEIEILQDAKSGIFGLVGVKKAKIRAKKAELVVSTLTAGKSRHEESKHEPRHEQNKDKKNDTHVKSDHSEKSERPERSERSSRPERHERHETRPETHSEARSDDRPKRDSKRSFKDTRDTRDTKNGGENGDASCADKKANGHDNFSRKDNDMEIEYEGMPNIPLTDLDQDALYDAAHSVMQKLTAPIVGEANFSFDIEDDRLKISIACDEAPGLLIGRDGQTLASLQYLSSRILSMRLNSCVRVQIDAGDYRERQDERVKEITLMLAEKVRTTGHAQYTRPLSSYHRRLVHLALQTETDLITRSKGDGPLKRVAIIKKRT